MAELSSAIEAILFAAGEPVPIGRISLVLAATDEEIARCASALADSYIREGRGMRILRLGDKLQMCSAPECAAYVTKALEHRKPPKLSPPALETLAIIAYFQPVTRAYIDQVRGVDSAYTVSVLLDKGLIEVAGRLDAPGRPAIFQTTDAFLRTMGVSQLSELPQLPELTGSEGAAELQNAIDEIQKVGSPLQLSLDDMADGQAKE